MESVTYALHIIILCFKFIPVEKINVSTMQFLFHVPLFQIMMINAMQGKSRAYQSLIPSHICI